jgi:CRISPR-associated exonuclease Cas4
MPLLPVSSINDYLYCPRRAALKFIEGLRGKNEHTLLGDQAHEHVDFPGYEQRAGWTLLRALPLYSDKFGLSGKADLVEVRRVPGGETIVEIRPVEYKKGPARKYNNDEAQLCAQALCLEEMFGLRIESGAIYHASSQKRRDVCFDESLRIKTRETIAALRQLIDDGEKPPAGMHSQCEAQSKIENRESKINMPPAELRPQCEGCSLHEICLPEATACPRLHNLYEPRHYA